MAVIGRRVRDALVGAAMLLLALLIIAKLESEQASRSLGPFTVIDGDTLADKGKRLRLRGVDAPELGQICSGFNGDFDCGALAREGLIRFIQANVVECFGLDSDTDRYGRRLVTCRSGDMDIGREMVGAGLALSDGTYYGAEREAKKAGLGIWAGSFEPPEKWRRQRMLETREPGGWLQRFLLEPLADWFARGDAA